LVENVSYNSSSLLGMFSADMSGTLAYFGGAQQDMLRVTVLDRDGHVVDSIGSREVYSGVRLSPGEDRLAVVISDESSDNSDIWIYDLDRRIRQRFTSDSSIETSPVWSPDGDRIAYRWQDAGKWEVRVKDASGIGSAKTLFESEFRCIPHDWSPDGQYLAIHFGDSARNMDIGFLPLDGTGVPLRFMPTSFTEADPKYSPDGRWIAYMTTESGRSQVCVAGSRGTTRKWQISTEDGWLPRWRRDGREIFYLSSFPVQIMVAEVDGTGEVFKVGAVRSLFPAQLRLRGSSYDVSRNGERIYLASTSSETETPSFTLVLNWPAELAKK
jgi:Tol biopolymer transport system component